MEVTPCIWNIQTWERYGIQSWPYVFLRLELTAQIPYLCVMSYHAAITWIQIIFFFCILRSVSGSLLMKKLLAIYIASRAVYVICWNNLFCKIQIEKTKTQQMCVILLEGDLRALNLLLYCFWLMWWSDYRKLSNKLRQLTLIPEHMRLKLQQICVLWTSGSGLINLYKL